MDITLLIYIAEILKMKKKYNRFAIVYSKIRNKHPNYTHKQLVRLTMYALR